MHQKLEQKIKVSSNQNSICLKFWLKFGYLAYLKRQEYLFRTFYSQIFNEGQDKKCLARCPDHAR